MTEQFPYPLDNGGNVRTFQILRALGSAHEVTLLSTVPENAAELDLGPVQDLCRKVALVRIGSRAPVRELAKLARSLATGDSFIIARHKFVAVQKELTRLLAGPERAGQRPYDIVHFNHLDAAQYEVAFPPEVTRVLDAHNVVSNQVSSTLTHERSLVRRVVLKREHNKLMHIEKRLCNRMNRCLVCSDHDASSLRALGVNTPISVIPNGVDLVYFEPGAERVARPNIIFVGALDYDPCERGVWFFCTKILPHVRREWPDARFVVVGRNPSPRLRALASADPDIMLTGRVADVRPHAHGAAVFVVPLLSGSGTRLKILEAMAMGVPVVTTSIGVQGIDAAAGRHVLIADESAEFARAVASVIRDRELASSLRAYGRRLVEEKYGWEAIGATLLKEYRALRA